MKILVDGKLQLLTQQMKKNITGMRALKTGS
jgi:hypothetical protein